MKKIYLTSRHYAVALMGAVLFMASSAFGQYCIPEYTTGTIEGDYLGTFVLGTINNVTGAGAAYNDYTGMSTDLTIGSTYTATITNTPTWPENYTIWIDYNQDGDLYDAGENVGYISLSAGATGNITFTVPVGTVGGATRLRVRCIYSGIAPYDPCALATFGETEDYTANMVGAAEIDGGVSDVTSPVSGVTLGVENVTVTVHNYGSNPISEFPVNYSVDGGATVTETYTGTIAAYSSASFTFAATHDFSADGCYSILAWTSVPDDAVTANDSYTESVCNLGPITGTGQWYIYSNVFGGSEPWFTTTNTDALNQAFGPEGTAWNRGYFETVDPLSIFSSENCFVWLEGSDFCAIELETFLTANMSLIENWVASGGKLFLNAAPNEGDGMSYGFGGTTLTYAYYTSSATAVDALHPIFNGPWTPAGTDYTGTSFGHAIISGTGLTNVMVDLFSPTNACLTEKTWGDGRVMFGGMTTTNFHSPAPNALNLRANILAYLGCNLVATCEIPSGLYADGITTNDAVLHWNMVDGADQYRVTLQNTATGLIKTKGYYTNMVTITDKLNPLTTYAFRVKTVCYDDLGTISAPSPWYYFTTLGRIGETDASMTLFPNPNNGSFTLQLNDLQSSTFDVNVFDAIGHLVYSKTITADNSSYSEQIALDVPAGMYQVRVSNALTQMTYPVVIQK